MVAYQTAIVLNPKLTHAYRPLVSVLRESGKRDELAGVLKQWLKIDPDNPIPQHMLAVYSGEDTPTRASDDYVRQVFNEFAATFDEELSELDYQGPRLIGESLVAELGEQVEGLCDQCGEAGWCVTAQLLPEIDASATRFGASEFDSGHQSALRPIRVAKMLRTPPSIM